MREGILKLLKLFGNEEENYSDINNHIENHFFDLVSDGDYDDKWIKIESEEDLPKENSYDFYHVFTKSDVYIKKPKNQGIEDFYHEENKIKWWIENVSHYQPIKRPLPPKS